MHISPDLKKLIFITPEQRRKKVAMNIADINEDINLSTYCHENIVLSLPATEKGVCTLNRKDATHNINQKLQEIKSTGWRKGNCYHKWAIK